MIQDFNFLQPKSDLDYLTDDEKLKWGIQTQIHLYVVLTMKK